jgi:hypothetical protein
VYPQKLRVIKKEDWKFSCIVHSNLCHMEMNKEDYIYTTVLQGERDISQRAIKMMFLFDHTMEGNRSNLENKSNYLALAIRDLNFLRIFLSLFQREALHNRANSSTRTKDK